MSEQARISSTCFTLPNSIWLLVRSAFGTFLFEKYAVIFLVFGFAHLNSESVECERIVFFSYLVESETDTRQVPKKRNISKETYNFVVANSAGSDIFVH